MSPDPCNPIVRFLYQVTEPVLRADPPAAAARGRLGLDLSPLIVILAIYFLQWFLVESLRDLAVA